MAIHQIEKPDHYLNYIRKNPKEAMALFRDLLIGVTNFFRDPEVFDLLKTEVIPSIFVAKSTGETIRVWVCGCSTGEEAYSIAMLIQEHMDILKKVCQVQIFATDIDPQAIDQARSGLFPASIVSDVSTERLARFFDQDVNDGFYRIRKSIRDLLIFSEQDVIKDPPFSKLDLISCRNLLIYMSVDLQKRLIPLFHYALRPEGVLLLGTSESVGEFQDLFKPLDRKWKLYFRQNGVPGGVRPAVGYFVPSMTESGDRGASGKGQGQGGLRLGLRELTEKALLRYYAQVGILVSGRGEILHIHGRTGQYLEPAPGDAEMNAISMAREGLRRELATALHRAATHRQTVRRAGVRVRTNSDYITADLAVVPAVFGGESDQALTDLYVVILQEQPAEETAPQADKAARRHAVAAAEGDDRRVTELEQVLRAKEEYLQTTLEEMETSKEELQSVNEELATVNAELQTKVADLSRANNDMNNLLAGTGVGTLFVDHHLCITRFTPAVTHIINLIQTDIGRPVSHIVSNLVNYDRLGEDIKQVLATLIPNETEVRTHTDEWYLMHIRPSPGCWISMPASGISSVCSAG